MKPTILPRFLLTMTLACALHAQTGIYRADPVLNQIAPPSTVIEKLAGGFTFTEGPVWVHKGHLMYQVTREEGEELRATGQALLPGGYLLFSNTPNNATQEWAPGGKVRLFPKPRGYNGADARRALSSTRAA